MAINFSYETDFELEVEDDYSDWIARIIRSEGYTDEELDYIFCGDDYLLEMNQRYLNHDTLTDIITFDYTNGKSISGDVFISIDRVLENAEKYEVEFEIELRRVMAHGVLHLMNYKDKTTEEAQLMREKEDEKMKLFHVEQ